MYLYTYMWKHTVCAHINNVKKEEDAHFDLLSGENKS